MNIRWRKLAVKLTIWLALEIILTSIGLDDLADCGEYIFGHGKIVVAQSSVLNTLSYF